MGDKVELLAGKLGTVELARVYIPPHVRVKDGKRQDVDGYWREVKLDFKGNPTGLNKDESKAFKSGGKVEKGSVNATAAKQLETEQAKKPANVKAESSARENREDREAAGWKAASESVKKWLSTDKEGWSKSDRRDDVAQITSKDGEGRIGPEPNEFAAKSGRIRAEYRPKNKMRWSEKNFDNADDAAQWVEQMLARGFFKKKVRLGGTQDDPDLISLAMRVYVPPHTRVTRSGLINVDGYWRRIGNIRELSSDERMAITKRAIGLDNADPNEEHRLDMYAQPDLDDATFMKAILHVNDWQGDKPGNADTNLPPDYGSRRRGPQWKSLGDGVMERRARGASGTWNVSPSRPLRKDAAGNWTQEPTGTYSVRYLDTEGGLWGFGKEFDSPEEAAAYTDYYETVLRQLEDADEDTDFSRIIEQAMAAAEQALRNEGIGMSHDEDDDVIEFAQIPVYVPPHVRETATGVVHVKGYTRMVDISGFGGDPDLRKLPKVRTQEGHLVEAQPVPESRAGMPERPRWGGVTIDGPIVEYALDGDHEGHILERGHVYEVSDRTGERHTLQFRGLAHSWQPGRDVPEFRDEDTGERFARNLDGSEIYEIGEDLKLHPLKLKGEGTAGNLFAGAPKDAPPDEDADSSGFDLNTGPDVYTQQAQSAKRRADILREYRYELDQRR